MPTLSSFTSSPAGTWQRADPQMQTSPPGVRWRASPQCVFPGLPPCPQRRGCAPQSTVPAQRCTCSARTWHWFRRAQCSCLPSRRQEKREGGRRVTHNMSKRICWSLFIVLPKVQKQLVEQQRDVNNNVTLAAHKKWQRSIPPLFRSHPAILTSRERLWRMMHGTRSGKQRVHDEYLPLFLIPVLNQHKATVAIELPLVCHPYPINHLNGDGPIPPPCCSHQRRRWQGWQEGFRWRNEVQGASTTVGGQRQGQGGGKGTASYPPLHKLWCWQYFCWVDKAYNKAGRQ